MYHSSIHYYLLIRLAQIEEHIEKFQEIPAQIFHTLTDDITKSTLTLRGAKILNHMTNLLTLSTKEGLGWFDEELFNQCVKVFGADDEFLMESLPTSYEVIIHFEGKKCEEDTPQKTLVFKFEDLQKFLDTETLHVNFDFHSEEGFPLGVFPSIPNFDDYRYCYIPLNLYTNFLNIGK